MVRILGLDPSLSSTGWGIIEAENNRMHYVADGYIKTDKRQMTSISGVFAGGDLIKEENTVAYASVSGRNAAYNIDNYLKKFDKKSK